MRHLLRTRTRLRTLLALAVTAIATLGLAGCATTGTWETEWGDDEVFDEWDDDGDGLLDENEFTDNVEWFDDYDDDGDGQLDKNEFEAGPAQHFDDLSDFDEYDEDGDGNLTEDEFNSGLFDDLDDNDDGSVDGDEWGSA